MARDESKDVWLTRQYLEAALETCEPMICRVIPESNNEYMRLGYARYSPTSQLEEAEKRIAELEQKVAASESHPPRCKDGCGFWRLHSYGYICAYQTKSREPQDGSGWCAHHTSLLEVSDVTR